VGFWVYKQEMCAPSWEMLVKKSELNPQKLAFLSSGASGHMTSCKGAMECYKSIPISSIIRIGNKTKLQIIGTENVKMSIIVDGKVVKYTIENVLHVLALGYNLFKVRHQT
jgi:hypothetical protein